MDIFSVPISMISGNATLTIILALVGIFLSFWYFSKVFFGLLPYVTYRLFFWKENISIIKSAAGISTALKIAGHLYLFLLIMICGYILYTIKATDTLSSSAKIFIEIMLLVLAGILGWFFGKIKLNYIFSTYSTILYNILLAIKNVKLIERKDLREDMYNEVVKHESSLLDKKGQKEMLSKLEIMFLNVSLEEALDNIYLRGGWLGKSHKIRLLWDKLPGDIEYTIHRNQESTGQEKSISTTSETNYLDENIEDNDRYTYWLSFKKDKLDQSLENVKLVISTKS